jgi:hypothetical protein
MKKTGKAYAMIMIFKIFLRKKLAKKKAVFAQTNASFC